MVAGIGDVDVTRSVHRHASGRIELCQPRQPTVPAESGPRHPPTCNGVDCPCSIDLADAVVAGIGDVDATRGVYGHTIRTVEPGMDRWPSIPDVAGDTARASNCDNRPCRIESLYEAGIGDVDVTR